MAEHVSSRKTYVLIFLTLLALTGLTVWVAQFNLGAMSDVVALAIAAAKALLVILFFMHVKESSRLTKLVVAAGFFWLALFVGLILTDYLSRSEINAYRGVPRSNFAGQLGEELPAGKP